MTTDHAEKQDLKKHVAVVHCSGTLSLLERKVFNVLLMQAFDDLLTKQEHTITMAALAALANFDSNNTKVLKDAIRALTTTGVEFDLLDGLGVKDRWAFSGLIAGAEIRRGKVTYGFYPLFAREMHRPEVYARVNLLIVRQFRSAFSLNLYENTTRFRGIGTTGWWDIATARKLIGAQASYYDDFFELSRKVLKPAVAECNQVADFHLEMEVRRANTKGRPAEALRFRITETGRHPVCTQADRQGEVRSKLAYKALVSLGVSDTLALATVAEDEARALQVANYVKKRMSSGRVISPGGYAAQLIRTKANVVGSETAPESQQMPSPVATDHREADLKRERLTFERQRQLRVLAGLDPMVRKKLLAEWVDEQAASQNTSALRYYDPKDHVVRGIAAPIFESYAVLRLVGKATEQEFTEWRIQQAKSRP